jgi:thymidylate kinase
LLRSRNHQLAFVGGYSGSMSRPLIIELTGLPAAGKTSVAQLLTSRLQAQGIACETIDEAAQRNPLQDQKCEWPFNVWSSCRTLMDLLEAKAIARAKVIVVDRGLVDAQCWMLWFRTRREIDDDTYLAMRDFLRAPAWASDTSVVVELKVHYDTALRRRHGNTGRIFNSVNFSTLSQAYESTVLDEHSRHPSTKLASIETDHLSLSEVAIQIERFLPRALQLAAA